MVRTLQIYILMHILSYNSYTLQFCYLVLRTWVSSMPWGDVYPSDPSASLLGLLGSLRYLASFHSAFSPCCLSHCHALVGGDLSPPLIFSIWPLSAYFSLRSLFAMVWKSLIWTFAVWTVLPAFLLCITIYYRRVCLDFLLL